MYDVPSWVIDRWEFRTTYIGQGELLAGPIALSIFRDRLTRRDITWYVDNTAALTALVKTSSVTADNSPMAHISGLLATLIQARVWYEWVPTHQNASDGLSRDGWLDRLVQKKLATGEWEAVQTEVDWHSVAGVDLDHAIQILQRWEV